MKKCLSFHRAAWTCRIKQANLGFVYMLTLLSLLSSKALIKAVNSASWARTPGGQKGTLNSVCQSNYGIPSPADSVLHKGAPSHKKNPVWIF